MATTTTQLTTIPAIAPPLNPFEELALENLALLEFLEVISVLSELPVVSVTVLLVALVALGLLLVANAILKDLSLMAQAN